MFYQADKCRIIKKVRIVEISIIIIKFQLLMLQIHEKRFCAICHVSRKLFVTNKNHFCVLAASKYKICEFMLVSISDFYNMYILTVVQSQKKW